MTAPSPPNLEPNRRRLLWRIARVAILAYLAILLGMAFFETNLVYPIPAREQGDWQPKSFQYEDVRFASADGTKLHGWFIPHAASKFAILYCHGNGEDISSNGEWAAQLAERLQASVFIFDYRGYGQSEGRPNEAGCIADGSAAQHWLAKRTQTQPDDIVLMGRSLGSAVAVALAAQNGARALVLENAFPTMPDVAAAHYPWLPVRWLMRNRYDNVERIKKYSGPLLQSHGTDDQLIPIELARRLFDTAPGPAKRWIELPGLGHNSPVPRQLYDELAAFLQNAGQVRKLP